MKLLVSALFVIGLYGRASSLSEPEIVFIDSSLDCSGGHFSFQFFFDEPDAFLSWILADMEENVCSTGSETLSDSGILYDIPIDDVDPGTTYFFVVMLAGEWELSEYDAVFSLPENLPSANLVAETLEEGYVGFDINIDIGESESGAFIFTITTEEGDVLYLDEGSLLPWDNLSYEIPLLPEGSYLLELTLSNGCDTFLFYHSFVVVSTVCVEESPSTIKSDTNNYDILGRKTSGLHGLPCSIAVYPHSVHVKRIQLR